MAYVELLRKYRRKEPQELRVVVGKDVRNSSPRLKTVFVEALVSKGVHVIDIAPGAKVSSTPLMYFATWLFIQMVALKSRAATSTRNGTGSSPMLVRDIESFEMQGDGKVLCAIAV